MTKKTEILRIMSEIRQTEYSTVQSIDLLLEYAFKLSQYTSFSGEAMSEAKELLLNKRSASLLRVDQDLNRKVGPSIMKDYINDLCSQEHSYYELCERCNRLCVHTIDLCRTAISALKEENKISQYSNSRQ